MFRRRSNRDVIVTQGDALRQIAHEDKDALKLVGDIMEHNHDVLIRELERQLEAEKQAHAETRRELKQVDYQLETVFKRVGWLMGGGAPDELIDLIEETVERKVP